MPAIFIFRVSCKEILLSSKMEETTAVEKFAMLSLNCVAELPEIVHIGRQQLGCLQDLVPHLLLGGKT